MRLGIQTQRRIGHLGIQGHGDGTAQRTQATAILCLCGQCVGAFRKSDLGLELVIGIQCQRPRHL
ncbi:MAG: hypothetical protein AB2784_24155, partial [Candidatus Thiodiazotropha endolucinida]